MSFTKFHTRMYTFVKQTYIDERKNLDMINLNIYLIIN